MFTSTSLNAQSYTKFFPTAGQGYQTNSAKVWHIDEDHYYLFRTYPELDNNHQYNHLQIIEYDRCGVVETREIYFDQLWSLNLTKDIEEKGDSLYLPVRTNPAPNGPHTEIGLIVLHKKSLEGRYQYLRALNVIYTTAFSFYNEDYYLLEGFVSYTDRPTTAVLFLLDREFNVLKYYQYEDALTSVGDIQVRGNDIYLFSGRQLTKLSNGLTPFWSKSMDKLYYILKSHPTTNGFVLTISKRHGDRQLFLIKIDYDGNLIWTSKNLNPQADETFRPYVYQDNDTFWVLKEARDENYRPKRIVATTVAATDGAITGQWSVGEEYKRLAMQGFCVEENGGVVVAVDSINNTYVFKIALDEDALCPIVPFEDFSEAVNYEIRDTVNHPSVLAPFETGSFKISPFASEATVQNLCMTDLPNYDLIPSEVSLCGDRQLEVDLTSIPHQITWSDGGQERLRIFNEPGIFSYHYELCDEDYGEAVEIKNSDCPCDWFIPNAFSPNNGTPNDIYQVFNSCSEISNFSFQVFNRWGGLMFSSTDQNFQWDGTWKGRGLQSGVYTYLMYYEDAATPGQQQSAQGAIFLMR